jgi:hypothetical protein
MARLSLPSARHNAPPYEDIGRSIRDQPRQIYRYLRKKLWLPASYDVGILAGQIRTIIDAIPSDCPISKAGISIPHLAALYQDDLEDAAEYAKIRYLSPPYWATALLFETAAAFTGYGLGLCQNYEVEKACFEEVKKMRHWNVFTAHYSHGALTTSIANIWDSMGFSEQPARHAENFSLGYDMLSKEPNQGESYWAAVHKELRRAIAHQGYTFPEPDLVLVTGDAAHHPRFMLELRKAVMSRDPVVFSNDTTLAVAKGTAEILHRLLVKQPQLNPNITKFGLSDSSMYSLHTDA